MNRHQKILLALSTINTQAELWEPTMNLRISSIPCSNCGKSQNEMTDEYYAITHFFTKGWRATKDYCSCPECAKNKLKL